MLKFQYKLGPMLVYYTLIVYFIIWSLTTESDGSFQVANFISTTPHLAWTRSDSFAHEGLESSVGWSSKDIKSAPGRPRDVIVLRP